MKEKIKDLQESEMKYNSQELQEEEPQNLNPGKPYQDMEEDSEAYESPMNYKPKERIARDDEESSVNQYEDKTDPRGNLYLLMINSN